MALVSTARGLIQPFLSVNPFFVEFTEPKFDLVNALQSPLNYTSGRYFQVTGFCYFPLIIFQQHQTPYRLILVSFPPLSHYPILSLSCIFCLSWLCVLGLDIFVFMSDGEGFSLAALWTLPLCNPPLPTDVSS